MVIKWRAKISVLDAKKRNVSVTLEQIDDADPESIKVLKSFSVLDALIGTPVLKKQVLDELKRQYYAQKQRKIDDAKTVGTLAEDIVVAAENWEAE